MKLAVATGNSNKVREIQEILDTDEIQAVTMRELGFEGDIIEDGSSFCENARIKARALYDFLKAQKINDCYVLADDSGFEVDYLDKMPGIYSARFLGEDTSYTIKNQYLIDKLDGVPDELRSARFVCCMAAVAPDGRELTVQETMEGILARESAGNNGFGYDPILYLPDRGCTSAQLSPKEKNLISHRGKALRRIISMIMEELC